MPIAIEPIHRPAVLEHSSPAIAAIARNRYTWPLFVAQLCILALFIGMSLVAIAVHALLAGAGAQRTLTIVALLLAGVALTVLAWRSGARWLSRVGVDAERPVQTELALVARDGNPVQRVSLLRVAQPRNGTLLASHR